MRPLFQADADFNNKIVRALRRREPGIDFMEASAGRVVGVADPNVLQLAAASGRILISDDRKTMPGHFARFIEHQTSPGVLIVPQSMDIGAAVEDLHLIWAVTTGDYWINRLGFVPF